MADSETLLDTSQQVTSKTPTTRVKDPKKVAAGKALQRKNREAREAQKRFIEAQKKELDDAKMKIAKLENAETPGTDENSATDGSSKNVLTTQWLSIISIIVSLAGASTTNAKRSKTFLPKKPPHHRLFCHERPHHRLFCHKLARLKSDRWIEHFICLL